MHKKWWTARKTAMKNIYVKINWSNQQIKKGIEIDPRIILKCLSHLNSIILKFHAFPHSRIHLEIEQLKKNNILKMRNKMKMLFRKLSIQYDLNSEHLPIRQHVWISNKIMKWKKKMVSMNVGPDTPSRFAPSNSMNVQYKSA